MKCEISTHNVLEIDDDLRGYNEFSVGDDISLELKNEEYIFGELAEIHTNNNIIIKDEEGNLNTIYINDIVGYL